MSAIIIIGAGEAGVQAALTLRQLDSLSSITLLGDEPGLPYERPPLSKQCLLDNTDAPAISGSQSFSELDIHYRSGETVVAIDRPAHQIELASGERLPYDKLLLATGASARPLTVAGLEPQRILTLRTRADAERIRSQARPGQHVVLAGAGFISLELAASLRHLGLEVTVLEAAGRILQRALPASISQRIAAEHQQQGVKIRCNTRIEQGKAIRRPNPTGVQGQPATQDLACQLQLNDGSWLEADWLLAGIGSVPNTTLAARAGLTIDNGIQVDQHLRTSDPDIYAAGDCCQFPHPLYQQRLRLESWRCAREQGELAALNMLGGQHVYQAAPWFWSDQYQLGLQMVGMPIGIEREIVRNEGDGTRLVFLLDGQQQLKAVCGIGPGNRIARDIKLAERLLNQGIHPAASDLSDATVSLKQLLKAGA